MPPNSVAAALHARGRGLSSEQLEQLRSMVVQELESEHVVRELENDRNLRGPLRGMFEAEARRAFSDAVDGVVNERQRRLLLRRYSTRR